MNLELYLIYIAVILLLGTLSSVLARHLGISNVFFLLLTGMVFGAFIKFPNSAIITISTIALIMVIFDSANKFSIKAFLSRSIPASKLSVIYLILNMTILTAAAAYLFDLPIILGLLLSSMAYGIDPMIALIVLKGKNSFSIDTLKVESIINSPITLIFSFSMISLLNKDVLDLTDLSLQIVPFFQQIILGLGVGTLMGLIVVMIMKHNFMGDLSHLALLTSAIITYVAAEFIEGNGVLAITAFGIIFGTLKVHHKVELENFASIFSYTLEILVFILMGTFLIVKMEYILKGSLLFLIYIIIRFISVYLTFRNIAWKEILFMSLNVPKGIDVAIVVLFLMSRFKDIQGIEIVLNLSMLFVLFSIVLSTLVCTFGYQGEEPSKKHESIMIKKKLH